MKYALTILTLIIFDFNLFSQNLSGTWGYKIDGNYINLYGDKIENQNNCQSKSQVINRK